MALTARDIMTGNVEVVSPDDSVRSVLQRLARADFNGFPVVDDAHRVVGIITQGDLVDLFRSKDRVVWIPIGVPPFSDTLDYAFDLSFDDVDLGIELIKNARKPIRGIMTDDVVTVQIDATIADLLDILTNESRDINRVPVLDGDRLVGIITREDLLRAIRDHRSQ